MTDWLHKFYLGNFAEEFETILNNPPLTTESKLAHDFELKTTLPTFRIPYSVFKYVCFIKATELLLRLFKAYNSIQDSPLNVILQKKRFELLLQVTTHDILSMSSINYSTLPNWIAASFQKFFNNNLYVLPANQKFAIPISASKRILYVLFYKLSSLFATAAWHEFSLRDIEIRFLFPFQKQQIKHYLETSNVAVFLDESNFDNIDPETSNIGHMLTYVMATFEISKFQLSNLRVIYRSKPLLIPWNKDHPLKLLFPTLLEPIPFFANSDQIVKFRKLASRISYDPLKERSVPPVIGWNILYMLYPRILEERQYLNKIESIAELVYKSKYHLENLEFGAIPILSENFVPSIIFTNQHTVVPNPIETTDSVIDLENLEQRTVWMILKSAINNIPDYRDTFVHPTTSTWESIVSELSQAKRKELTERKRSSSLSNLESISSRRDSNSKELVRRRSFDNLSPVMKNFIRRKNRTPLARQYFLFR